jgi:hypothetical protein
MVLLTILTLPTKYIVFNERVEDCICQRDWDPNERYRPQGIACLTNDGKADSVRHIANIAELLFPQARMPIGLDLAYYKHFAVPSSKSAFHQQTTDGPPETGPFKPRHPASDSSGAEASLFILSLRLGSSNRVSISVAQGLRISRA